MKSVGTKPRASGWIPRSGIYFPLLKKVSLSKSTLRKIALLPIILKSFYPQLVFPTPSEEKSAKTRADVKIVLQKAYPIKTLTSPTAHRDGSPVACPTNTFPLFLVTTYAKAPASCKPSPHQTL